MDKRDDTRAIRIGNFKIEFAPKSPAFITLPVSPNQIRLDNPNEVERIIEILNEVVFVMRQDA